jgi:hypothetical protein
MKGKTTLTLDEPVWRVFRAECIRRGVSASRMVQEFMRETLKKWGVETAEEPPKRKPKK